jgi:GNAT superfamily N-acetyltransferase
MRRHREPGLKHRIYRAVRLTPADTSAGGELSTAAGWNQTERDWNFLLRTGHGFGFETDEARLVASTVVTSYGKEVAWVSMVLVAPEFRQQGLAAALVGHALSLADRQSRVPLLDATLAGRQVYAAAGFRDLFGITRWMAPANIPRHSADTLARASPMRAISPWTPWDETRFGVPRKPILAELASGRPDLAFQCDDLERDVHGFCLGRSGRVATHLGPVMADTAEVALTLLRTACDRTTGPAVCDVVEGCGAIERELMDRGFAPQRPFIRMARGPIEPWGIATGKSLYMTAGPELG